MGVLQCLQTLDRERLDILGESGEDEMLALGMKFLEAGRQQNSLAATYITSLRQVATKNRARVDGKSSSQRGISSASLSDAERDVQRGSDLVKDASSYMIDPAVFALEAGTSLTNPVEGHFYPGSEQMDLGTLRFGSGFPPDLMWDENFNIEQFMLGAPT